MKTGKNTTATTTAWLLSVPVMPNQALKIGARATIGVALTATANGVRPSLTVRKRVERTARSTPAMMPTTSPLTAMRPVSQPACRSVGHWPVSCAHIDVGRGSRNSRIPSSRTPPSHAPRNMAPVTNGGTRARSLPALTIRPPRHAGPREPRSKPRRTSGPHGCPRCAHRGRPRRSSGCVPAGATARRHDSTGTPTRRWNA